MTIRGVILGVSNVKHKGFNRAYRYIALQTDDGQRYLVRLTLDAFETVPMNAEGEPQTPKSGDLAQIEHYRGPITLEDGTKMVWEPKIFTIYGHITEVSTQRYYLDGIYFFDWGVVLKNAESKCVISKGNWDQLTGLETSSLLWKLKKRIPADEAKECYIEITTTFKVYYGWRLERKWLYRSADNGFEWRITAENLQPMRKIVIEDAEARKARMLIDEIKQLLQCKLFLPWEDVLALARKYTIEPSEVEEYVKNVTWKKNYDEEYAQYLKAKAKQVFYGHEGLFFVLPGGITVLEVPEPNKATYVFLGEPNFIASRIEGIRQEQQSLTSYLIRDDATDPIAHYGSRAWREILYRLKKKFPEKFPWFIGRVIHYDKEQWKRDLEALLKGVTGSD